MALARSASGPGGLSINTSSANNLFGQSSNQAPAAGGGLFGSAQAQPAQGTTTSSLFGNTGAAASTPKTGGLFGSTAAAPSQPQQTGGGLFGNTGTQQQAGSGGGGLFGGAGNTQQQTTQQTGGGLFGGTMTAQQQPAQQTGGGLFGGASNTAQPQQPGGLFGGTNTNTQAQQPAAGGLFGGATAQSQNQGQASGGLFGGSSFGKPQQQQQPQQGSSLFGQPAQQKTGLFGNTINGQQSTMGSIPGLTMGQGQSQPAAPGARIERGEVRGTTRFNDLNEELQKDILEIDKRIQTFMTQKAELDAFMPGHGEMLSYIPDDVKFVERKHSGVQSALESDAEAIEGVRLCVEQDAANAKLSFRAIDNLKLPTQYHTSGLWSTRQQSASTANAETDGQGLVGFFNRTADEMDSQLKVYEKQLTEIETHMRGVQDNVLERLQQMMASKNNGPSPADQQLADLGAVLRDFEMGILRVAGDVGAAKEGMARLQLGEFMNASEQQY